MHLVHACHETGRLSGLEEDRPLKSVPRVASSYNENLTYSCSITDDRVAVFSLAYRSPLTNGRAAKALELQLHVRQVFPLRNRACTYT